MRKKIRKNGKMWTLYIDGVPKVNSANFLQILKSSKEY